ncbi:MAG: hypothetical protein AAFQ23_01255 [Cyanobacteria bacterium J06623_1]
MQKKIMILPHVESKTSFMVSNALTATIDNNIERVYDFIVAEDVDLNFLQGRTNLSGAEAANNDSPIRTPRMLGYEIDGEFWNQIGATRISSFEGDAKIRETIIDCQRPYLFQYMLTDFVGGWFEESIDLGISTFCLSSFGPRTRVNWQYQMRPINMDKIDEVHQLMSKLWYPWQESFFNVLQEALNKDPWSA